MRIRVDYESTCSHSYSDGKQYGDWEERYDSSVTDAYRITDEDKVPYGSESFLIPDDATEVFVVYMIYDTGDSFGRAYSKIDILHATISEFEADKLATMVTANSDDYTIKFKDDFGRDISIDNRGAGYFEEIRYVGVDRFTVGSGKSKRKYFVN